MGWSFLTRLLEEIHNHSTFVGKIWLTVLIVFRIMLTVVAGESIYYDEQSKFVCNTGQPGCENVCYDSFAPLSHVRFWVFQTIVVASPSLMYLVYTVNKLTKMEDQVDGEAGGTLPRRQRQYVDGRKLLSDPEEAEDNGEKEPMIYEMMEMENAGGVKGGGGDTQGKVKVRHDGRKYLQRDGLMKMYVLQLLIRSSLEVGFLCGQYALYGFAVPPAYECSSLPCPHTVNCFVSRPTEKTIFLIIMYAVSFLCLILNIWEMIHLGVGSIWEIVKSRQNRSTEDELYRLTKRTGSPNDAASNGREYDSQPCSWDVPTIPLGYNFPVRPLLVSTAANGQPLPSITFGHSTMAHQQNNVNIAQEECQQNSNNDDNVYASRRGVASRVPVDGQKKWRDNEGSSKKQLHSCKNQRERNHRQASKHSSNRTNRSNAKYGEINGTEWI